ncbi:hypothetical protein DDZ14_17900 [Maritimibacter sp. 55A14]|uniref:hypothetical protein n=1 Tax=Maritimibacter sp. 55A14 TaxID=2174844 RepID=UPI000D61AB3D|nr:hypothetical protein [Maritimibacter sp. 55A14]PWE29246.1 hypothetical protein DDZ14_17900 [Maritimibacter sp. 55A14]
MTDEFEKIQKENVRLKEQLEAKEEQERQRIVGEAKRAIEKAEDNMTFAKLFGAVGGMVFLGTLLPTGDTYGSSTWGTIGIVGMVGATIWYFDCRQTIKRAENEIRIHDPENSRIRWMQVRDRPENDPK